MKHLRDEGSATISHTFSIDAPDIKPFNYPQARLSAGSVYTGVACRFRVGFVSSALIIYTRVAGSFKRTGAADLIERPEVPGQMLDRNDLSETIFFRINSR